MSEQKPISSLDVYFKYSDELSASLAGAIRFLESSASARNRYATGLVETELEEAKLRLGRRLNSLYTLKTSVLGDGDTGGLVADLAELAEAQIDVLHRGTVGLRETDADEEGTV